VSDVEWYVVPHPKGHYDIRARREFPGPPRYHAFVRWIIKPEELHLAWVMRWLVRSMLHAQRKLDTAGNVDKFEYRPAARGVIQL
jgi:hypothetical protein